MPPAAKKAPKVSRNHRPETLSIEDWQRELRRQFGREQQFQLTNVGSAKIYSEFAVANPQSQRTYRVLIRGQEPGDSACTCGDFLTNALGTCKHIEFTVAKLQKRFGRRAFAEKFEPLNSEIWLHYGSRRQVQFRPGQHCPAALARLASDWFENDGILPDGKVNQLPTFIKLASVLEPNLFVADDVRALVAEVRDNFQRRLKLAELFPRGVNSAAWKSLIKTTLYDYQKRGALFAAIAGRCLIGDEMGLGKTVQAIAAVEILAKHFGVGRVLIVCPASLKHQWRREIAKFTGRTACLIDGLRPARLQGFADPSFFKIVNYDTVHADLDQIAKWSPDLVILDEAQRIKNWSTRTARSVKQIDSPFAIVLTGTPLENRLEELISIVQFVDRHRLGPTYQLLDRHQVRDENGRVIGYKNLNELGKSLSPIVVRRTKKEVLNQLPPRIDQTLFVPMTPQQRELHAQYADVVARIVAKWRRYHFLTEADQRRMQAALQSMRMSCDSTFLLDPLTEHGSKPDEIATLLGELAEEDGTKAVVFSQWLRMHELIVRRLKERGIGHVLFHGGVPSEKRGQLIDRFMTDPEVRVFLSTDAGGVGLNLQKASIVINADLPWNPAVLEQRIGRAHRLGQTRAVRVVNFVSQGTIEHGLIGVLNFKRGMAAGVLDGGADEVLLGGSRLKKFMETVEKASAAIPAPEPASEPTVETQQPRPQPSDAFTQLLEVGRALLDRLSGPNARVERDSKTGEQFLRLPVPPNEVLAPLLEVLKKMVDH